MSQTKILIIGKIPPPIGGVTIHVSRLLNTLEAKGFNRYVFLDLAKAPVLDIVRAVLRYPVTHLHTSHAYLQLLLAILCAISHKKLIITYHGNLGRYNTLKNMAISLSCRMCYLPIVQNEESLAKAIRLNPNAILISSYIPLIEEIPFNHEFENRLIRFRQQYNYIFCTNASNLTFDKDGKETYGISELIQKFTGMPEALLIVSDPSGTYSDYMGSKMELPSNVCILSSEEAFNRILRYADAFIRNSTTDGDSISIHEALAAGVVVFASNVVSRPAKCIVYEKISQINLIVQLNYTAYPFISNRKPTQPTTSAINSILNLYYNAFCIKQ